MLDEILETLGRPKEGELTIILVAALEDPDLHTDEYQSAISEVHGKLVDYDPNTSSYMLLMESAAPSGWAYGVFGIVIAVAGPHVGKAFDAWFSNRAGRKVRLKVGDIEVEAHSIAEIEKLLEHAKAISAEENQKKLSS